MKFKTGFFVFRNIVSRTWCKSTYKYIRGIIRYTNGKYQASIDDFQWILDNGAFAPVTCLLYENLGINYARLQDFNKAEEYLVKSSIDKKQQDNGYLFMWLGYIYLVKKRYEESLNCFLKARQFSQQSIDKWLVDHQYIQERIDKLEDEIKNKYKEILTNN